jgi:hypothetical protein
MRVSLGRQAMKFSVHSLTSTQQTEFESLARSFPSTGGYRWLATADMPSAIPASLRAKMRAALAIAEKTSSGCTILVCNGIRVDRKSSALDQEPFGVAVYSSGASTAGIFIHHGAWKNRTIPITPEIRLSLESTALAGYYPLGGAPSKSSGPLSDLSHTPHEGAFKAAMQQLLSRSS